MKKALTILLAVAGTLFVLVAGVLMMLESEWTQGWIERKAAEKLGREVFIGKLDVRLRRHPRIEVEVLRVGNPQWAKTKYLIDAEQVGITLHIMPLFAGKVVIDDLLLRQAKFGLERDGNRVTWRFKEADTNTPSPFEVRGVNIDQSHIAYRDTNEKTDLAIDVQGDLGSTGELKLLAAGTFRGQAARAVARVPALMPTPDTPVAISAAGVMGHMTASAAGTVRAVDTDGFDLTLEIAGDSLDDLDKLVTVNLPETPPYRLRGRLRNPQGNWIFDPFDGHVGDSDLRGSVNYITRGKTKGGRPLFKATLVSDLLDFDDLGPLVGAPPKTGPGETASPQQKAKAGAVQARGRVLPDRKFEIKQWPRMDADVRFEGKKVLRPKALPINGLSTHLVMENAVLHLQPLQFDVAGGHVVADITLDGRQSPLRSTTKVGFQGLDLAKMFPTAKTMESALGKLYGRADLTGRGNAVADLLATGNGSFSLLINGGQISNLLMEAAGLDLFEALQLLATHDRNVQLRCAVADFKVKDGIATSEAVVLDTSDTIITAAGTLDFRTEALNLKATPEPKDRSPFVLRTPLLVRGTFGDPKISPQVGPIAVRAAAGGLLALVNPLLALAAFIETGPGKDSNCGQLIAERTRPGKQRTDTGTSVKAPAERTPDARTAQPANPSARQPADRGASKSSASRDMTAAQAD
jgi:uncharacterized protein involved in outer membrane biogenesis